ncbi:hypothetical protein PAMP_013630 [Pampus punctatissimus]
MPKNDISCVRQLRRARSRCLRTVKRCAPGIAPDTPTRQTPVIQKQNPVSRQQSTAEGTLTGKIFSTESISLNILNGMVFALRLLSLIENCAAQHDNAKGQNTYYYVSLQLQVQHASKPAESLIPGSYASMLIMPMRNSEDFTASLSKLRQLIEDKVHILQSTITEDQQGSVSESDSGREGLWRFAVLSKELISHLQQLQRQTEQELSNIHTQKYHSLTVDQLFISVYIYQNIAVFVQERNRLFLIKGRQQPLTTELLDLQEKKKQTEQELKRSSSLQTSTFQLCAFRELQASITERLVQTEKLVFQEEALSALRNLLTQDLQRSDKVEVFSGRSMQEKNETEQEHNMSPLSPLQTTNKEAAEQASSAGEKKPTAGLSHSLNLHRGGSVKNLISKFSGPHYISSGSSPSLYFGTGQVQKFACVEALMSPKSKSSPSTPSISGQDESPISNIIVTPLFTETSQNEAASAHRGNTTSQITASIHCPVGGSATKTDSEARSKTEIVESSRDSVTDTGMGSESEIDLNKQLGSPSEDEPATPRVPPTSQNPKYQLFLSYEVKSNGLSSRDADGSGGGGLVGENSLRLSRWEPSRLGMNHVRGSLESLASRDWDTMSDRGGPVDGPARVFNSPYATSIDFHPMNRISKFKGGLSTSTTELNNFNSLNTSPVGMTTSTLISSRPRISTYDTLKRKTEINSAAIPTTHYSMRSATLGVPNKKNYIEELTKQLNDCQKRNQFLEAESVEMEKERNQIRFEMRGLLVNNEDLLRTNSQMAIEMKRMREQMIEMERDSQSMRDRYKEMEIEVKEARDLMVEANTQEYAFNFLQQSLKNKIQDAELGEALQASTQSAAEMNLQQKLREDAQLRVEELEESLLEKDQELQRLQALVGKLQGEVSGKLIDKERSLEEEIQLRERLQLQCKQAERTVDDLQMELHGTNQTKEDLAKQLKQAQEKLIDLESDLEEQHESEQRWAAKHKRAIEQTEQLQLKLIQEKELNDQLETEKVAMERQMTQRIRTLKRQLNEVEEEASRKEAQYRHTQRELAEEREASGRLQRQLLDQHLQTKRKDTLSIRQTLDNLRLDLSVDDDDDDHLQPQPISNGTKL